MWWEAVPAFTIMATLLSVPWWIEGPVVRLGLGVDYCKIIRNKAEMINALRDQRMTGDKYTQASLRDAFPDVAPEARAEAAE